MGATVHRPRSIRGRFRHPAALIGITVVPILFVSCYGGGENGRADFWASVSPGGFSTALRFGTAEAMADGSDSVILGSVVDVREGRPLTVIADGQLVDDPQGQARTTMFDIEVESVVAGDVALVDTVLTLEVSTLGVQDVDRTRLPSRRAMFFIDDKAAASVERTGVSEEEAARRHGELVELVHPGLGIQVEQDGRVVAALDPPAHGHEYDYMTDARSLDELAEDLRRRR